MQLDIDAVKASAAAEWAARPALRAEFSGLDAYTAYRVADARGAARIFAGKSVVRGDAPAWPSTANTSPLLTSREPAAPASAAHTRHNAAPVPASGDLIQRQALVRQQNIGRQFAGLQPLPIPQQ